MEIVAKTIENDEAYLRQVSNPVDLSNEDYKKDIETLREYLTINNWGFALAAVQIGIPKRILYIRCSDIDKVNEPNYDEQKIMINPVIISAKGITSFWEGCYSCLNYTGLVKRPYEMTIEYYDEFGVKQVETFKGFIVTILCHELDHFDGILHMDIALEVRELNLEERTMLRAKEPYQIISETGEFVRKRIPNPKN